MSLLFLLLACGAPVYSTSFGGRSPWNVCSTGTPVPTVTIVTGSHFEITPNAAGTPISTVQVDDWVFSTPEPTETPYYILPETGGFWLDEPAIMGGGQWEVALRGKESRGGYTIAHFTLANHTNEPLPVALTLQMTAQDTSGTTLPYDDEAQKGFGLIAAATADTEAVAAGATADRYLSFKGEATTFGLNSVFAQSSIPRPVWFHPTVDPKIQNEGACAHGLADWSTSAPGAQYYVGEYGSSGAWIPPSAPFGKYAQGQYSVGPSVGVGEYPVEQPWHFASWHMVSGHRGYDLTSNIGTGDKYLRMGPNRPIRAIMGGFVQKAQCGWNTGYGCYVVIRTAIGADKYLYTYYAHMWGSNPEEGSYRTGVGDPTCDPQNCKDTTITVLGQGPGPLVSSGQFVPCGTTIGFVGMSGHTNGAHLHWEMRIGGYYDPPYLPPFGSQFDPEASRPYWQSSCYGSGSGSGPPIHY